MNVSIQINRVLAVLILAFAFVLYIHHDYSKWTSAGRDAYLNYQATRFDHHISQPHWAGLIVGCFIVFGIVFVAYELLAFLLGRLFIQNEQPVEPR